VETVIFSSSSFSLCKGATFGTENNKRYQHLERAQQRTPQETEISGKSRRNHFFDFSGTQEIDDVA